MNLWIYSFLILTFAVLLFLIYRLNKKNTRFNQSEKELLQTKALNQLLIDSQESAILLIGTDGVITVNNSQVKQYFASSDLKGKHIKEVVSQEGLLKVITAAFETKERIRKVISPFNIQSNNSNSSSRQESAIYVKIDQLEYSNKSYTRVRILDITEQHRTEQIRKDFVANASHELRTPLAIINGYVENLLDDEVLENKDLSKKFLGIMHKNGQRITRIIEEMLLISKLESETASVINSEPFYVKDLIDDAIDRLGHMAQNVKVQIKVKMPDPEIQIVADQFYLSQVLFNLVENAIKQNNDKDLKIKVGCAHRKSDDTIKIWISDNGVGIPAEDLPFIFDRFYRVEKHHSQTKIKGTGLGLSIVKRAVEAHGGTVTVQSIPSQLTTFSINLPARLLYTEEDENKEVDFSSHQLDDFSTIEL